MCTNAWERLSDTLEVFLFVSSHDSAIMNFLNMYLPVDSVSKTFRQKKRILHGESDATCCTTLLKTQINCIHRKEKGLNKNTTR